MVRILHIDDARDEHELTRINLERLGRGLEVEWVASGQAGLEKLEEERFDCILCDYQMPGLDGLDVLSALRERGFETPFIFLTGQGNEQIAAEALRAGADDYFTKDGGLAFYERLRNSIGRHVEHFEHKMQRKRAEERHRMLFESMSCGAMVCEPVNAGEMFLLKEINSSAERIEGVERKASIGRRVGELLPEEAGSQLVSVLRRVYKSGVPEGHEINFKFPGGKHFWRKYYIYRLPAGEVVAIFDDVTSRKQAEIALRASERRNRELIATVPYGIIDIELNGKIAFSNPAFCRMVGRDDLDGLEVWELAADKEEQGRIRDYVAKIVSEEPEPSTFFARGRDDGGNLFNVQVDWNYRRNEDGTVKGVIAVVSDVTERERATELIREERDRAQQYLDIAGVMLLAIDNDGKVSMINKRGCEILGYEEEEILGKDWLSTFVPAGDREIVQNVFKRIISGELNPGAYGENRVVAKGGREKLIAWRNTMIRNAGGEIVATLSSGEDITDRRRADEE